MKLSKWWQLLLAFLPAMAVGTQAQTVWQIGKFDESPVEFSRTTEDSANFEVGKSKAETDWPGQQKTGHPYRILFALESASGAYTLKIATLIERPREIGRASC